MTELKELYMAYCEPHIGETPDQCSPKDLALLRLLYEQHRDKAFTLIEGFETGYGLHMLAALSGYKLYPRFPIQGKHMHIAAKHYQKVLSS